MSNFGQGFQNAGFDPSLLYLPNSANVGGAGGVGNVSNMGGNVGGVGGMNLGDQKVGQNQSFNLGNLGGGVGGSGLGGNMGVGNANSGALPQGWLNQFTSLQSHASQQLNQNAQGGAGQGLNAQNLGMLNNNDGGQQRQMEIVSDEHRARLTRAVTFHAGNASYEWNPQCFSATKLASEPSGAATVRSTPTSSGSRWPTTKRCRWPAAAATAAIGTAIAPECYCSCL